MSGTSAGALSGAALRPGSCWATERRRASAPTAVGGRGRRDRSRVHRLVRAIRGLVSKSIEYSLPYAIGDAATRMMSPYGYGPFFQNR